VSDAFVALITGGGGIGSGGALTRRFARGGFSVLVCDVDEHAAAEAAAGAVREGGRAIAHRTDVRLKDSLSAAFARARTLGRVAAVVNNASDVSSFDPGAPLEHWDTFVETDFLGTAWSTRLAIDALRAGGGGGIVNVSSTSALPLRGSGGSPMYDVTKKAILQLSLRLGFLRDENIRVNCIVPHWIAVPHIVEYVSGLTPEQRKERGVPDRLIPVEEIADTAYRLATDTSLAGEAFVWPDGRGPILLDAEDI
jgi:NAD(P)-dependent dehydrogenase (short-subunit alcohol dehydrogenase family)